MKKLAGLAMAGLCMGVMFSCEKAAENPGDFSVKSTLNISPMCAVDEVDDSTYEFRIIDEYDTAFMSSYTKQDTTFDEEGNPVIGSDGKIVVKTDTIYFRTGKKAHYYEMDTVIFPSYADTFTVHITSNALWKAPQYKPKKTQWFYNYNIKTGGTSLYGGGDGYFYFRTVRNKNKKRTENAEQYIYTSDSTVMYHFVFGQRGEKDK